MTNNNHVLKIGCVIAYGKGHNNYGTSLQGYAMIKKIQELGCKVEVIDYEKRLSLKEKIVYVINALRVGEINELCNRFFVNRMKRVYPQYGNGVKLRTNAVDAYKMKKIIPFFQKYIGYKALREGSKNYDYVVVGSDQVWTPLSLPNKFFNLLFVSDSVKKVAYASSFGVSEIPKFQQAATGKYLDRFYKISVREQRGKEIVESLSHQKAYVVVDPTLLLSREEWEKEISEDISETTQANKSRTLGEPYIFCYLISPNVEARQQTKMLSEQTGLPIIAIRHMEQYREIDETIGDEVPYSVDPNDFVRYISKAAYICTDSFHCTVFSILFHRQFMTFFRSSNNEKTNRNSRIGSLFDILEIPKDHLYSGDITQIKNTVNWENVDNNISTLRSRSMAYLQTALQ
jgi:hypothetical protein